MKLLTDEEILAINKTYRNKQFGIHGQSLYDIQMEERRTIARAQAAECAKWVLERIESRGKLYPTLRISDEEMAQLKELGGEQC